MATRVWIASIICNPDNGLPDSVGTYWYVQRLDGWDSPPQRLSMQTLPAVHGEIQVENLYSARTMAVGGLAKATRLSEAESVGDKMYESMYYMMSEWNATANTIPFRVKEEIDRICWVNRSGPIQTRIVAPGTFAFEATFRSDDPTKFSPYDAYDLARSAGTHTITNLGTIRTYPIFTINAAGNCTIQATSGSRTLLWSATDLDAGTVVNMKTMTCKVGSVSHYDKVAPTSEWIFLEPGDNSVNCNRSFNIKYRDAWI